MPYLLFWNYGIVSCAKLPTARISHNSTSWGISHLYTHLLQTCFHDCFTKFSSGAGFIVHIARARETSSMDIVNWVPFAFDWKDLCIRASRRCVVVYQSLPVCELHCRHPFFVHATTMKAIHRRRKVFRQLCTYLDQISLMYILCGSAHLHNCAVSQRLNTVVFPLTNIELSLYGLK